MVNVLLTHGNIEWVFSGVIVFVGVMVMLYKLRNGKFIDAALGIAVWIFVYKIHGMSTSGIMSATLAALLFDTIGIRLLRR